MAKTEFYIYSSWCFANGIKVYPKPITSNGSICLLILNQNGIETLGTEKIKNEDLTTKITDLYRRIYDKHNNTNSNL